MARGCTILVHLFEHRRAAAELGQLLEASNEGDLACATALGCADGP